MKQIFIYIFAFILGSGSCIAQDEGFYLKFNSDTILAGNVLEISFIANNVSGQFEAPDLEGLNIISGPNTSSEMSIINGTVMQRASYNYVIYMEEIGEVIIPPAFFMTNEGTLETEPKSILVLPNPEGIIENPPSQSGIFQFSFPNQPSQKEDNDRSMNSKKKKRKLKKI